MKNFKEDLSNEVETEIKRLKTIKEYIKESEFLNNLPEGVYVTVNTSSMRILIRVVNDYPLLVDVLRVLRKETGEELKIDNNWYSCGVMLFSWITPIIKIWFESDPNSVPKELLPSGKCEVKEQILEPEKTYSIVCDLK